MLSVLQVFGALLLLVAASDAFTNAVEWIGSLYGLTRYAVGAVVAAIGSSLPETMIAIVALLVLHDQSSREVGIGAVLGAPFMLGTLVFAMIGAIGFLRPRPPNGDRRRLDAHPDVATFGLALFAVTFGLVVGASFYPTRTVRLAASIAILGAYVAYLLYHFRRHGVVSAVAPPPLRFQPSSVRPHVAAVILQLAVALVLTVAASRWFVTSVGAISAQLGVAPLVASLFLSPIATELPEAMNVTIWLRRGQDELALGNVLGAMMFQTSIASAIAMLATPWNLGAQAYAACAAALAGVAVVFVTTLICRSVRTLALAACGIFYFLYVIFAIVHH